MISRKDNLLIRPWQQRKFENHRRKVQSALPAIDTTPPAYRSHVALKLKKQQREAERCKKIENDNFLLLQKMDHIMKTSRIDNTWKTPQPNFLNKIGLYNTESSKIESILMDDLIEKVDLLPRSRKSKCYACSPPRINEDLKVREERIPWEPEKRSVSRIRSKSVPARKSQPLPTVHENFSSVSKPNSSKLSERPVPIHFSKIKLHDKRLNTKEPQSIILARGCLKLYVNFPSDTVVKFQKGNVQKVLMKEACHCKNSPTAVY